MADPKDDPLTRLKLEAMKRAAASAGQGALDAAEAAGHGALDALERALFGKVGGAEEALGTNSTDSALDNVRRAIGATAEGAPPAAPPASTTPSAPASTPAPARPARPDPEAEARAQLAELKRQLAARRGGAPPAPGAAAPSAPPAPGADDPDAPPPGERKRTL